MRILVALGGNALLRRGEALTADNQRRNVRRAALALAPLGRRHQLVISHGNGPQVGLLALQSASYEAVQPYPLDVLGAQTEGMIGYMIEQELGNLLPFEVPFATMLTMVEVDRDDPGFKNPTKFIGPVYSDGDAERLKAEKGWTMKKDGDKMVPVFPHELLKVNTIFEIAHAAGLRTAYIDKHPAYEIVNGPSGTGLDDFYAPESEAKVKIEGDGKEAHLVDAATAGAKRLGKISKNIDLSNAYDDLRLAALLHQIDGQTSAGAAAPNNAVPATPSMRK